MNTAVGTADPAPDSMPAGVQATASLGTVSAFNEQGWGRDAWGAEVWGAEGIWSFVNVTGVQSSVSLGNEDTDISVTVELSAQSSPGFGALIGWGDQKWGQATVNMGMNMSQGAVDPGPDVSMTGVNATTFVEDVSITANADVSTTGQQLNISLGNEDAVPNTQVDVTGIQAAFTLQGVVAGASAEVDLTGVTSTSTTGIIGLNAWELVDSGTAPTWTVVDKAA